MSGVAKSGWGDHEWLIDREARRGWLRFVGLYQLMERILRTPVAPRDAVLCVLDEVFVGRTPLPKSMIALRVREDGSRFKAWLRSGMEQGSRAVSNGATLAVILPDGEPYCLQLALANTPPEGAHWSASIAWRGSKELRLALLDRLLPRTKKLSKSMRSEADYILPLAHTAFLLRDALLSVRRNKWRGAIVSYAGGDEVQVPLK